MLNQKLVTQRKHLHTSARARYCLTISDLKEFYCTTENTSLGGAFLEKIEPAMLTSFSSIATALKLAIPGNRSSSIIRRIH